MLIRARRCSLIAISFLEDAFEISVTTNGTRFFLLQLLKLSHLLSSLGSRIAQSLICRQSTMCDCNLSLE